MPKYQPIPDNEENIANPPRRSLLNIFSIAVLLLILVALFAAIYAALHAVPFAPTTIKSPITIYQTSKDAPDRLSEISSGMMVSRGLDIPPIPLGFGNIDCRNDAARCASAGRIVVNNEKIHQLILGFGGAFTEASAYVFQKLPGEVQDKVIELYFGDTGIGYTMGRVHINSCDFGLGSYNFDDVENDYKLEYFDYGLKHDTLMLIPLILAAMKASSKPIRIVASPWSPPAWMKQTPYNQSEPLMIGSADPLGLRDEHLVKNAWADYICKWLFSYLWVGIPIWGLTVQNEPKFAAPWEALKMNEEFQRDFVHDYLGPQLDKNLPWVKLFVFDHNKNNMSSWVKTVLEREENNKYVAGVAFHWYAGSNDRQMDGTYGYDEVNKTHHLIPDKMLLATEGCSCPGVELNDWFRAERFAHDVIFDLLNHAQGWLDWNILLDSAGGPNHLNNTCDAPVVANPDYSDIHIQPKYYFMGHFSKYVPPGSRRLQSSVVGNYQYEKFDPRVRAGIEASMYSCEKSSRQIWRLTEEGYLALSYSSDQDGYLMEMCVAGGINDRPFVRMVYCREKSYSHPLRITHLDGTHLIEQENGLCIGVVDNNPESGAMLELSECTKHEKQRFSIDIETGEVKAASSGLCVTAGWPFLTGVSFFDEVDTTVTVLMNEASVDTEVILHDIVRDEYVMFGINARSIQTITYK